VDQAQELRVRALWAEIADQLLAGHDLSGSALADFKAAYASGLLTRYAEPWEANLAKAYAQKLKDSEHHSLLDQVESALGDAGGWAYNNVVVPTVNGAASLGNAVVNDPGDTASTILGGLAIGLGATAEGGGTVLDATGVGAVVGVPLNAAGATMIAGGVGLTAKGAAGLGNYAAEHPTQIVQSSASDAAGGGSGPLTGDSSVPQNVRQTLDHVEQTGSAPEGYRGGTPFENDGRAGGERLPTTDADGNPIAYKEYDVNAYQKGVNRGGERIVIGDDGSSYYTTDHYRTFTKIK
jgi:guanyl-specific ribonuclease Sa